MKFVTFQTLFIIEWFMIIFPFEFFIFVKNINTSRMSVNKNNYCIIMAGGIGARFWPMSKTSKPKQFIDILGTGTTLIQQTFNRFLSVCPKENILIVTNQIYKELVLEHIENHILEEIPPSELYMMCKMLLLREWLSMSKSEITRDIKEVK